MQSADYFNLPVEPARFRQHEDQFLELLIEEDPPRRSGAFASITEAIEAHERDFLGSPDMN